GSRASRDQLSPALVCDPHVGHAVSRNERPAAVDVRAADADVRDALITDDDDGAHIRTEQAIDDDGALRNSESPRPGSAARSVQEHLGARSGTGTGDELHPG